MAKQGWFSLVGVAVLAVGCGPAGPEVRLSPDALTWRPGWIAALPVVVAGSAVPATATMPEGLVKPTGIDTAKQVSGALYASFAGRGEVPLRGVAFTASASGKVAEKVLGQYLDTRAVDPALAMKLGADTGAEALLVVAVLRYGPEVEGDLQRISQGANTTLGTSQLAISTSVSRAVVYFNAQFRCAVVRCSDGAVLWDAAVRRREKRMTVLNVTQESVLREAAEQVVDTFPWAKPRPAAQ